MSQLASLLDSQAEEVRRRWSERLREAGESAPRLHAQVPRLLAEMAAALRRGRAPEQGVIAELGRALPGDEVGTVPLRREFSALRQAVLDLAEEQALLMTAREVRLLIDVLSLSLTERVAARERARAEAEHAQVKATVQALHERESRLSTTLASIGDAVISTDAVGHVTFVNRVAERLTGWTEQEAQGRPMSEVFRILNEHTREPVMSPVDKVLAEGTIVGLANHTLLVRKDGTEVPIDDSAAPIRDVDGELLGVVLVFRDISERKHAEREREALVALEQAARAEAEAERAKLQLLFMQAPVPIAILEGPEHLYTFANPAYRALVNGRAVVGKTLAEALPEVREQGFDRLLDQVMATGVTYVATEMPVRLEHHAVDEALFLDFTYAAKRDAAGQIDGVLVSAFDVTSQVLARQRVETLAEQVRLSQERLHQVVLASGAGTWEVDVITYELTSDARHRELLGLDPRRPLDLATAVEAIHPDDREGVSRAIACALAGENDGHYYSIYRSGGRDTGKPLRWIESRGRVVLDSIGRPIRLVGTSHDVTARQVAEQERQEALTRVTEVLESMGDGFFALSADWRVTLVNRNYERLVRLDRASTIGKKFWDLFPDAATPRTHYFREYHRCMDERVPVHFVDYYPPLDLWTDVRGYPTRDGGISVFFRDVSVEHHAEQALRASEERYRTLFESIDDGFCLLQMILDESGKAINYRFLEANAAFETQTGLTDPVGKTIRELVPGIDESWIRIYGQVAETGETQRFENHEPAMQRWFEAYASRVGDPDRRLVALVFKNITERKKNEQERERLLAELARSNQELDQFAYVASHDLKAPLRGIANLAEWIEEDLGDAITADARDKLVQMRGRVRHLDGLIRGILDYSTAGRTRARPEPIEVGKLLSDVVDLLSPPAHLALTIAPAMPTVVAERVPLQQVFMNLIGNAVKHTSQPGGAIEVGASDEGPFVHFTVRDNGPGIAPEFHESIWGVFQKVKTASNVEGSGIGLAVVKKIVESRGGKTWVESATGQGATFHVRWPRQPVGDLRAAPAEGR